MAIDATIGFGKVHSYGIGLKMQRLISGMARNNCPKFNVYLVSNTYLLISL